MALTHGLNPKWGILISTNGITLAIEYWSGSKTEEEYLDYLCANIEAGFMRRKEEEDK